MEALDLQLQQTKDRCARQRLRVGRRDRHHRTRRNALSAMGASPCHGCAHSESPFVRVHGRHLQTIFDNDYM